MICKNNLKGGKNMTDEVLKTPIEIALEIDEDGYTTASSIYKWLELAPSNFARWCKTNIVENPFFEEGVDYFEVAENGFFFVMKKNNYDEETAENGFFDIMSKNNFEGDKKDGRGRPSTDYKVSSEMAKMLCMTSKSEKARVAHQYFVRTEKALVKATQLMISQIKEEIQLTCENFQAEIKAANEKIIALEDRSDKTDTRLGIIESGTVLYQPSRWVKHIISRIALLAEHYVDSKTGEPYSFARMFHFILDQLEYRYPGYNDRIREVEKVLIYNTGIKENRPIQIIDYDVDLRDKFNSFVNHELYNMGIIDEDEDQDEDLAMLRNLMPTVARF